MTLAMLTFVVTLSMVLGSYWLVVVRPEAQVAGRLRKRIQVKTAQAVGTSSIVKAKPTVIRPAGMMGALAEWHRRYAVASAGRLLESAGMRVDPRWLIGGTAIAFTIIMTAMQLGDAPWQSCLFAAAITPFVPYF